MPGPTPPAPSDEEIKRGGILAIDNDPEVLRLVELALGDRFECDQTDDIRAAKEKLAAAGFDLVLCKVPFPTDEPGLDHVEELLAAQPGVAVVMINEADDAEIIDRALELKVDGYLVKPFSAGQLLITAQSALRRRALEADERLRQRALIEQIQEAMERAPVSIYIKDLERRYLLANRLTHEALGLEPGEMIGRTDPELLSPESEPLVRESDMRVLRNGEACEREETVIISGRERTFLSLKFPYLDREGNLAGITGVSAEITAHCEAERLQRDLVAAREQAIEELRSSRQETVERLARAIELHDAETGRHVDRMARITSYLGSQLGLDDAQILLLRAAAPLHDVGKIAIPNKILRKPGPLTPEERAEMERHAAVGHQILDGSESDLLQMAARIALTHHEWFDGNGYPRGLKGEEIPIEGRIVAVADVLDALLSDRPYRAALPVEEAVELIREGRGTQFDPEVVDALLEHLEDALELRG